MNNLKTGSVSEEKHEVVYKKLKSEGYSGWGGENFEARMDGWDKKFKLLFDTVDLKNCTILELGCGAGDASIKLAELGHAVTGVDISPTAIDWAREKAKERSLNINFLSSTICEPSLLDGFKFDLVMDGCCLHCLFDEDRTAFYANTRRLMNDNGYFFINSAVLKNPGDPTPKLSSIERCVISQADLEMELAGMDFVVVKSWLTINSKHNHYSAICKKK